MQEYVQKSTRTTLPRNWLSESAWLPGVLNHDVIPTKFGALPSAGRFVLSGMKTAGFWGDVVCDVGTVVVVFVPAARCPL
jgi:hypothetical protein